MLLHEHEPVQTMTTDRFLDERHDVELRLGGVVDVRVRADEDVHEQGEVHQHRVEPKRRGVHRDVVCERRTR